MQYLGNREPLLEEIFDDPIVRLVMARDGISSDETRAYVEAARRSLGESGKCFKRRTGW
jgi:hypothetical protein